MSCLSFMLVRAMMAFSVEVEDDGSGDDDDGGGGSTIIGQFRLTFDNKTLIASLPKTSKQEWPD